MRDICTWSQAETFSTFIITEYRVHTKVIIAPWTLSGKSLTLVSFTSKWAKFEVFWRYFHIRRVRPKLSIAFISMWNTLPYFSSLFLKFFKSCQSTPQQGFDCWKIFVDSGRISPNIILLHIYSTTVAFKQNLLWDDICSYKARFKEEINDFNDRCCVVSLTEEKHLSY